MTKSVSTKKRKRPSPSVQLVAAQVLRDVVDRARSLDRTLDAEAVRLSPDLRPILKEIAYGACRK